AAGRQVEPFAAVVEVDAEAAQGAAADVAGGVAVGEAALLGGDELGDRRLDRDRAELPQAAARDLGAHAAADPPTRRRLDLGAVAIDQLVPLDERPVQRQRAAAAGVDGEAAVDAVDAALDRRHVAGGEDERHRGAG